MEPSVLHSQVAVFEEQDNGLYFALGLGRAAQELLEYIERETSSTTGPLLTRISLGGPESDDTLYFLLGLVAFARRVEQALERYEAGPPRPVPIQLSMGTSLPEQPIIRHILR